MTTTATQDAQTMHAVSVEHLWYVCTNCGAEHRTPWKLDQPQQRERRLACAGDCDGRTTHRLAGLRPTRRRVDCPSWCTDHETWRDGTEKHVHQMVRWQGWHTALGRWDYLGLEIVQFVDRPDLARREAVPHINCNLSIDDLSVSRRAHALLGQAIALIEGGVR